MIRNAGHWRAVVRAIPPSVRAACPRLLALLILPVLAQDLSQWKIAQLAQGYRFTEGAAWSSEANTLIFSDTPSDRLLEWIPGKPVTEFRTGANGPAGNAFDSQGRLYTCETRTRRVTRTDKKGKIEVLASEWEGKRLNAPLGIVVSRAGHVYFTDPAFGGQSDHRELDFYGVYHIPPKGPMTLVSRLATRPRGIALAPNGRTLYVADTDEHAVRAWELDRNGDPGGGGRIVVSKIEGAPAGLTVDSTGNLWVAARQVLVYSPAGERLGAIELHAPASSLTFGEADGKTLFLTERGNVYRARTDLE